jgi:hypothetical protein
MAHAVRADRRVQEAEAQAEQVCQRAVACTPAAYQPYLMRLPQRKKLDRDLFVRIQVPYMGVDGRVKMARDEHLEKGGLLNIQTRFVPEPISGQLLCVATVHSTLYGEVTAHARVFLGGEGGTVTNPVDMTNPLENAESSAVGRALGFLGYGLYGTGIASAEEVLTAQQAQPAPAAATPDDGPPSPVEIKHFWARLRELQIDEAVFRRWLEAQQGHPSTKDLSRDQRRLILDIAQEQGTAGFVVDETPVEWLCARLRQLPDEGWRHALATLLPTVPHTYLAQHQKELALSQTGPARGRMLLEQAEAETHFAQQERQPGEEG